MGGATKTVWDTNRRNFSSFFAKSHFQFFDDQQMACSVLRISRELEREGVVRGAYAAFSALRPAAFRADLWRYMVLWSQGGFYLDAKMQLLRDPRKWVNLENDTLVLVKDAERGGFWQGVLVARKRSQAMALVIKHVVRNVQRRFYPLAGDLSITGPVALAHALGMGPVTGGRCHWTASRWFDPSLLPSEEPRLQLFNDWDHIKDARSLESVAYMNHAAHKQGGGGSYSTYWNERQVYCKRGQKCMPGCVQHTRV